MEHHLGAVALEIGEAIFRPGKGDAKPEKAAPETQAGIEIGDVELGSQRGEPACRERF